MKALRNRLRRLEIVAAPDQEDQSIVEAIEAARKRRMGSVYEPRHPFRRRCYLAAGPSPITSCSPAV